ncbi:MAG: CPBP family intramembrane metalloprotease [Acidobacteria bacterium]|nr:CPBP family intramembrane metalloprotease [Acidobacteriota bacterium]
MTEAIVVDRPASNRALTWFGVAFSLLSMLVIRQVFRAIAPELGVALTLLREGCFFASGAALLWLVRRGENLPLRSIGIGTSPLWKSLAWGVVIAVACIVPAALIAQMTGYGHGAASKAFDKLPLWVVSIVVLRAGVVEELFFRGYVIERLQSLGFGRAAACIIPLAVFAVGHWTGGAANILIALVLGGILTGFYMWRRDLVSNMFGHFLVDFVANVLSALLA